jgi:hypothetical protein
LKTKTAAKLEKVMRQFFCIAANKSQCSQLKYQNLQRKIPQQIPRFFSDTAACPNIKPCR